MNDKEKIDFKLTLRHKAFNILHDRIKTSTAAMTEAQMAANEEGKSSMGDKYETSRAMAQIDRDIHARQLESAQKELNIIQQVDVTLFNKHAGPGAFVECEEEKYFFLTGLGPIEINKEKIIFLSINSPIGKIFSGRKAGDKIIFNGRKILIKEVF